MKPKMNIVDAGWIRRELRDLKRQIRELAAAKRLQAATIGRGGITVKDGGSITATYPDGSPALEYAVTEVPDGLGGTLTNYMLTTYTSDGSPLLRSLTRAPSDIEPDGFKLVGMLGTGAEVSILDGTIFISCNPGGGLVVSDDLTELSHEAGGHTRLAGGDTRIDHATTSNPPNVYIDPVTGRIYRSTA